MIRCCWRECPYWTTNPLRIKCEELLRKALEYEGDPIEDLRHILPEDFPPELWEEIINEP